MCSWLNSSPFQRVYTLGARDGYQENRDSAATALASRRQELFGVAHHVDLAVVPRRPATSSATVVVRHRYGPSPVERRISARNPKSSAQQIKTQPEVVHMVDQLLDHHVYSESQRYPTSEDFVRVHPRGQAERLTAFRRST